MFLACCFGSDLGKADLDPGRGAARLLRWAVAVACYANWGVTLNKDFLKVHGIDCIGEARIDTVFVALTLLVVVPTFGGCFLWVRGLWPRSPAAADKDALLGGQSV